MCILLVLSQPRKETEYGGWTDYIPVPYVALLKLRKPRLSKHSTRVFEKSLI